MDAAARDPSTADKVDRLWRVRPFGSVYIGMLITLAVQFRQRRLGVLTTMSAEEIQSADLFHPFLQARNIGAAGRPRIQQTARGLRDLVIIRISRGIEQRADVQVGLANQQPGLDEGGFAAIFRDLGQKLPERRLTLGRARQDVDGIFERNGANRLQSPPDFHPQIGRLRGKLMQKGKPKAGIGANHDAYVSSK